MLILSNTRPIFLFLLPSFFLPNPLISFFKCRPPPSLFLFASCLAQLLESARYLVIFRVCSSPIFPLLLNWVSRILTSPAGYSLPLLSVPPSLYLFEVCFFLLILVAPPRVSSRPSTLIISSPPPKDGVVPFPPLLGLEFPPLFPFFRLLPFFSLSPYIDWIFHRFFIPFL